MKMAQIFLQIAKDETETLVKYNDMLENAEDMTDSDNAIVEEIMSDEMNHALIALLSAANITGIKIATDDLSEDPNDIEVEESAE